MAITQRELAQRLGVSQTVIGNALHGNGRVGAELRERIVREAERLGYRTNKVARALKTGRSQLVALWMPRPMSAFHANVLDELQSLAHGDGFDLIMVSGDAPHLMAWPLDGVLASDSSPEMARVLGPYASGEKQLKMPLVAFGQRLQNANRAFDYVCVDLASGVATAVELLVHNGARSLAFVGAQSLFEGEETRLQTFRRALHGEDFAVQTQEIAVPDSTTLRRETRRVVGQVLGSGARFDGFVCGNDDVALGVLRALRDYEIEVPTQTQVIGCDDIGDAADADPPLSTLTVPIREMTRYVWEILCWRLENLTAPPQTRTLDVQWVQRQTTR